MGTGGGGGVIQGRGGTGRRREGDREGGKGKGREGRRKEGWERVEEKAGRGERRR